MITKLIEERQSVEGTRMGIDQLIRKVNELVEVINRLEVDNAMLKQKLDGGED